MEHLNFEKAVPDAVVLQAIKNIVKGGRIHLSQI